MLASVGAGKQDPRNGLLMSESTLSAVEELVQACQGEQLTANVSKGEVQL